MKSYSILYTSYNLLDCPISIHYYYICLYNGAVLSISVLTRNVAFFFIDIERIIVKFTDSTTFAIDSLFIILSIQFEIELLILIVDIAAHIILIIFISSPLHPATVGFLYITYQRIHVSLTRIVIGR